MRAADSSATAPATTWWIPLGLGVVAGLGAIPLASLEWAWLGFVIAAAALGVWLLAVADVASALAGLLVLSLQAGASYRVMHGRAGSEGLAVSLVVLVGVALVATWWARGTVPQASPTPLRTPALLVLLCSALSLLTTGERFVAVTHFLLELQLFFLFWLGLRMVQDTADLDRIVRLLLITLAIQSVIYALQSYLGLTFTLEGDVLTQDAIPRPGGTVSTNPAGFASFIMPLLLIALARLLDRERRDALLPLATVIVLGLMAIGLTYTRVAWAGLAGAIAWLLLVARSRGTLRTGRAQAVVASAVVVGLLCWPLMAARLVEAPVRDAYDERAGLMRIAMQVIKAHPFTGIGTGTYGQRFKDYLPAGMPEQWLYTVHNEYLLRAAEAGIGAAIAFIALLVVGFRVAHGLTRDPDHRLRTFGLGFSAALLALAWQMYWVPWRGFEYNALLWFMLGVTGAAASLATPAAQDARSTGNSCGAGGRVPPSSSAPRSGAAPLHGT